MLHWMQQNDVKQYILGMIQPVSYHMLHHNNLNPPLFLVSIVAAGSVTESCLGCLFLKVWPLICFSPHSVGAQLGFGSPKHGN